MLENYVWLDEGTPEGNQATDTGADTPPPTEPTVDPKELRNQVLRDLSKEYGVNMFDAEGIKQFKEFTESQKTELEKLQEQLNAYESNKSQWETEKRSYEAKLKASELGIKQENLEDALKLADGNPDNLAKVIEKYPSFRNTDGVRIGVQNQEGNPPTGNTEVDKYMRDNYPDYYKKWKASQN